MCFAATGVLCAGLVAWEVAGIPALVKYPTNIDTTVHYAGTFTMLASPQTGVQLQTPTELPLTIDRRIQAVGRESGARRVLVRETIDQHVGGALMEAKQTNVYVMDRHSIQNVVDSRAYAFSPTNVVNRSRAYRVNLPFSVNSSSQYAIYDNDLGTTYLMGKQASDPTTNVDGLRLDNFTASVPPTPVTPAYLTDLAKIMPLPKTLPLARFEPTFAASGIDLNAILAAVAPVLSAADRELLLPVLARPVQVQYVEAIAGQASIEPTTGALVNLGGAQAVGAVPVVTSLLPALRTVLAHHPEIPMAATATSRLGAMDSVGPLPIFKYQFSQTPASVKEVARQVKAMRSQIVLARQFLPAGLAGLAFVALAIGLVSGWRARRTGPTPSVTTEGIGSMSEAVPVRPTTASHDERRAEERRAGPAERRVCERRVGERRATVPALHADRSQIAGPDPQPLALVPDLGEDRSRAGDGAEE